MLASYSFTIVFVIAAMVALLMLVPQSLELNRVSRSEEPVPGASPTLAVAALIFAVFVPPIGLILAHFALLRISIGQASGRTAAVLAVWISVVLLVVEVVLLVLAFQSQMS
jgi:hypothetical protein